MLPSEKARVEAVRGWAAGAFARHAVTQNVAQGLYRHWSCAEPGSGHRAFNVTTLPGRLIVTGDMGELILCREPDMVEWFRRCHEDLNYVAGKAQGIPVREWCGAAARDWLDAEERGPQAEFEADPWDAMKGRTRAEDRLAQIRRVRAALEDGRPFFEMALHESRMLDGDDWPDLEVFTHEFLWCVEGLRWLVPQLPKLPERRLLWVRGVPT